MKRDISNVAPAAQRAHGESDGVTQNGYTNGDHSDSQPLDMIIVGAGFAGVYLLHQLRQQGFSAKIVEVSPQSATTISLLPSSTMTYNNVQAGSDLGGIWYWNRYPGARVDSQYPVYALSIPEVYRDWTWSSHYPDHVELREYFQHVEDCIHVKKDCVFDAKVTDAEWDDETCLWSITCETGKVFKTKFWTACTGFAASTFSSKPPPV